MKLKTLELQGFKSFPDRTVLNFERGVTAVVGPNGSGKSNISDAMRWVLGEISSKNIRGKKMEDVIFGGTDNRKPMGFAEVSITFDNTDEDNRIDLDYDEVTVTRRYYRAGDSEYMINRKPVRLKDITDLFFNTGIGKGGYSIIGQGKVAEIISQKSDERRMIFEEAAGIAKYRARKNEAERKLAQAEENLIRIGDILSELEGRVKPLEKDAAKARKYLELFEKKKALDVALCIYDISDIQNKVKKYQSEFDEASRELELADDAVSSLETQSDKLFEITQENKRRYEELNRLIRENDQRRFEFDSTGKVLENDISHINDTIGSANAEKERIAVDIAAANTLLKSSLAAESEKKAELENIQKQQASYSCEIETFDLELNTIIDKIDILNTEIQNLEAEKVAAQLNLSALEASGKSRLERKAALECEIAEIDENLSLINSLIERSAETVSSYTENTNALKKNIAEADEKIDAFNEDILEITEKKNTLSLQATAKRQHIEALRRMEEIFEGYSSAVRSVMSASEKGKLGGIIGPVSKILEVEDKYLTATETALGASIQNIVCEDERDAKNAIRYLKENKKGRATFYPLSSIKPKYFPDDLDLNKENGYIGIASELVKTNPKYRIVVDFLLARTAVFDNIDNANIAAKNNGFKIKCVTLDGSIINAGGSFSGGSARGEGAILSRTSDIEKERNEIAEIEKELDKAESDIDNITKDMQNIISERDDLDGKLSLFESLISAENTQTSVLAAQKLSDTQRKESLISSLSALENEQTDADNSIKSDINTITEITEKLEQTQAEVQTLISQREDKTNAQSEISVKRSALNIEAERKKKDIEACEYEISIRRDAIDVLISKQNVEDNKITAATERLEKIKAKLSTGKQNVDVLEKQTELMQKEIEQISEQNIQNEKKEADLREQIKDISHRREVFLRSYTKAEGRLEASNGEQDKITAHLWDEYELTYSTATELEYEPVTAETRADFAKRKNEFKSQIKALGSVNVNAVEEYEEVKTRYDFLSGQYEDITVSKKDLIGVIFKLEEEMRTRFTDTLEAINRNFKDVFHELFGGGSANLSLSDPENVLSSGIDINVAPPGKIINNLSLLSGGEQAFVAICLFFAILKVNPSPFCILDEIEAALDEVNVARFAQYCQKYSHKTQFIIITHRRGTMEAADILYGITMYERGVSKVLSVNVSEVEKKIGVKL